MYVHVCAVMKLFVVVFAAVRRVVASISLMQSLKGIATAGTYT